MSELEHLANRIRSRVALDPRLSEKKMFGGIGFLIDGNMFLGVTGKGEMLVRMGRDNDEAARALPGADIVDFDSPRRGGFVMVPADAVEEDDALDGWVLLTHGYVATLPPK